MSLRLSALETAFARRWGDPHIQVRCLCQQPDFEVAPIVDEQKHVADCVFVRGAPKRNAPPDVTKVGLNLIERGDIFRVGLEFACAQPGEIPQQENRIPAASEKVGIGVETDLPRLLSSLV